MTNNSGSTASEEKLIYILPRIRLSGNRHGEERFSIGKAEFIPDSPNSWEEVIELPRPDWLNIYKEFPYMDSTELPEPARGTLIISTDDDWLKKHISRLISMIYISGLKHNKWRVPANAFHYSLFKATKTPQQSVNFITKNSNKIEDLSSISLFPPLELRGVQSLYQINLHEKLHLELIRRFNENPYDRLVVACFHLFRSQYENPVISPPEQDCSAFCACLEASLDVKGPDYSKELLDKIINIYGTLPEMDRWIKGLYSERSVFNHGVSTEPTINSTDDRVVALLEFRQRPHNWEVLRHLCLDTIEQQLQNSIDLVERALTRMLNPTQNLLEKYFYTDDKWTKISNYFTQSKAVDKTLILKEGEEVGDYIELCCSYLNKHSWQFMANEANPKKIYNSLMAMAAVIAEISKGKGNTEIEASASQLFEAAKATNNNEIKSWVRGHSNWENEVGVTEIDEVTRAVALHTAKIFDRFSQEKK